MPLLRDSGVSADVVVALGLLFPPVRTVESILEREPRRPMAVSVVFRSRLVSQSRFQYPIRTMDSVSGKPRT